MWIKLTGLEQKIGISKARHMWFDAPVIGNVFICQKQRSAGDVGDLTSHEDLFYSLWFIRNPTPRILKLCKVLFLAAWVWHTGFCSPPVWWCWWHSSPGRPWVNDVSSDLFTYRPLYDGAEYYDSCKLNYRCIWWYSQLFHLSVLTAEEKEHGGVN